MNTYLSKVGLLEYLTNGQLIIIVQLPAHFLLWMSSPEASFLNGRSVWANWDVDELKGQAEQIKEGVQMTAGINGWPYASS